MRLHSTRSMIGGYGLLRSGKVEGASSTKRSITSCNPTVVSHVVVLIQTTSNETNIERPGFGSAFPPGPDVSVSMHRTRGRKTGPPGSFERRVARAKRISRKTSRFST
jgi:hypothetical protein